MVAEIVRPGALFFLQVWFVILVGGFLWRMAAAYFSDKPLGRAMAVIY